jgi:hypothetical protein
MLKKKVSRDGRVAQLSVHSALLYLMSIPHLDVDGRMDGNPVAVRGTVVPALASAQPTDWTDQHVETYMREWLHTRDEDSDLPRPLVLHYCTAGVWVCHFPGFAENQTLKRDRERPSSFPAPPPLLLERYPDADSGSTPAEVRTQAEAEVQVQEPPEQRGLSRARETSPAALQESDFSEKPVDDLAAGILEGVARRKDALGTHGALGRLLEVLPDADAHTPAVLHSVFDGLAPEAIEHARREILEVGPRRPSAYAVGIGRRLAGRATA